MIYQKKMYFLPDPFSQSTVDDTLESGGDSICWYKRRKGGYYDGSDACFCKTDLCNGANTKHLASISLLFIITILLY